MTLDGYRLAIDFGTSSTVAMLAGPDGRARPLLSDASPLLPSGVFAGPEPGPLRTGVDAEHAASAHPAGFEANPKRRIADGVIWLGDREVAVVDAIAAVLDRVGAEARRVAGGPASNVVLTHPAGWSRTRLGVLADAAERAGLGRCAFVAEPVAAAAYFADVLGRDLPVGRCLVVYDLGAGTCDASIVRRTGSGLEVVATAGLDDVGGLDLDAVIVGHAQASAAAGDLWGRLEWPQTPADRYARHLLWREARTAKEQLSRHATAELRIPLLDTVVHVTREEFEAAARPHLDRTVDLTGTLLRDAGVPRQEITGIFLVGGSSRVPLVASLLHRTLQVAPTALDHPELVVAEGALHASTGTARLPVEPVPSAPEQPESGKQDPDRGEQDPGEQDPGKQDPERQEPERQGRVGVLSRRGFVVGALGLVGLGAAGGAAWALWPRGRLTGDDTSGIAFSRDGGTLVSTHSSSGGLVRIWDVQNRDQLAEVEVGTSGVGNPVVHPDGKSFVINEADQVVLRDVRTGETMETRYGLEERTSMSYFAADPDITFIGLSPDGLFLAIGTSTDGPVLLDIAGRKVVTHLIPAGHDSSIPVRGVNELAFSPDGKRLAVAGSSPPRDGDEGWISMPEYGCTLWDIASRQALTNLLPEVTYSVAFSPTGDTVATAGKSGVRLWNASTGELGTTFTRNEATSLAFSPDGRTLLTGGANGVCLWDAGTGRLSRELSGNHFDWVAFSPGGNAVAAAAEDEEDASPGCWLWQLD